MPGSPLSVNSIGLSCQDQALQHHFRGCVEPHLTWSCYVRAGLTQTWYCAHLLCLEVYDTP